MISFVSKITSWLMSFVYCPQVVEQKFEENPSQLSIIEHIDISLSDSLPINQGWFLLYKIYSKGFNNNHSNQNDDLLNDEINQFEILD